MALKNLLVATDFSNASYAALFYATQLMKAKPCTFYIINVYGDSTSTILKNKPLYPGKKESEQLQNASVENLTKMMHRIVLDTANKIHNFIIISKSGALTKVLSKTIAELAIDLLVMGNKGKTGAKELFWGSNTVQMADTISQCPLLAIPKERAFDTIDEIALATDFKKGCSRKTLRPLLFLAAASKAAIRVVHIEEEAILSPKQAANKKLLKITLSKVQHSFDETLEYADKAIVIQTFLQQTKIKMLAMVYQKGNFFERFMREPVIKDISIYAKIPFLILPVQE